MDGGRIRGERDPRVYKFCETMKAGDNVYSEISDLFVAATDYLHNGSDRGAAVLLRAASELFVAHHLLNAPTEGMALPKFSDMIVRVEKGEGAAAGLKQEERESVCKKLWQIAALGDSAAHPRIYPPKRQRPWSKGNVVEDLDNFEKIVKVTVPWCNQ